MIIDADTHITPSGNPFSIEQLIDTMDGNGVDKALTWLWPDYHGAEIEGHNAYLYQATQKYPDRILGFGWADPTVGVAHAKEMVRRCVEEYGFYGVKLNGAQNSYYVDDPELARPVAEEIAKSSKMLAFHIGADAYERTHPLRAANLRGARMSTMLKVAVIGVGGIARTYMPGCAASAHSEVVAGCDINPEVLNRWGEAPGIKKLVTDPAICSEIRTSTLSTCVRPTTITRR